MFDTFPSVCEDHQPVNVNHKAVAVLPVQYCNSCLRDSETRNSLNRLAGWRPDIKLRGRLVIMTLILVNDLACRWYKFSSGDILSDNFLFYWIQPLVSIWDNSFLWYSAPKLSLLLRNRLNASCHHWWILLPVGRRRRWKGNKKENRGTRFFWKRLAIIWHLVMLIIPFSVWKLASRTPVWGSTCSLTDI